MSKAKDDKPFCRMKNVGGGKVIRFCVSGKKGNAAKKKRNAPNKSGGVKRFGSRGSKASKPTGSIKFTNKKRTKAIKIAGGATVKRKQRKGKENIGRQIASGGKLKKAKKKVVKRKPKPKASAETKTQTVQRKKRPPKKIIQRRIQKARAESKAGAFKAKPKAKKKVVAKAKPKKKQPTKKQLDARAARRRSYQNRMKAQKAGKKYDVRKDPDSNWSRARKEELEKKAAKQKIIKEHNAKRLRSNVAVQSRATRKGARPSKKKSKTGAFGKAPKTLAQKKKEREAKAKATKKKTVASKKLTPRELRRKAVSDKVKGLTKADKAYAETLRFNYKGIIPKDGQKAFDKYGWKKSQKIVKYAQDLYLADQEPDPPTPEPIPDSQIYEDDSDDDSDEYYDSDNPNWNTEPEYESDDSDY